VVPPENGTLHERNPLSPPIWRVFFAAVRGDDGATADGRFK